MQTAYDQQFKEISHYQRYPAMMPFVGNFYGEGPLQKILLVGESNYLPANSTIHHNDEVWYSSNQGALTEQEVEWIANRFLVGGDWAPAGHMIYKELNRRMEEIVDLDRGRAMDHVAYINGFQRPALTSGNSIGKYLTNRDIKVGKQVVSQVVDILEPTQVIFTSKLAWNKIGWPLSKEHNSRSFHGVCHPGTGGRYWHKSGYADGVNKFRALIANSLKE